MSGVFFCGSGGSVVWFGWFGSLLCACACAQPAAPAPNASAAPVAPAAVARAAVVPAVVRPEATATATAAASPAMPARKYEKPSDDVLQKKLSPLAYDVTQHGATEMPFANQYWNNHEDGIYVDAVTGEPLFSSRDKFDSGTGWPSFTRPIDKESVVDHTDQTLGMTRTEVRSKSGNSHLGHVFDDGPEPTGQRYCINSAALRFIPASDLAKEGYGEYASQFGR